MNRLQINPDNSFARKKYLSCAPLITPQRKISLQFLWDAEMTELKTKNGEFYDHTVSWDAEVRWLNLDAGAKLNEGGLDFGVMDRCTTYFFGEGMFQQRLWVLCTRKNVCGPLRRRWMGEEEAWRGAEMRKGMKEKLRRSAEQSQVFRSRAKAPVDDFTIIVIPESVLLLLLPSSHPKMSRIFYSAQRRGAFSHYFLALTRKSDHLQYNWDGRWKRRRYFWKWVWFWCEESAWFLGPFLRQEFHKRGFKLPLLISWQPYWFAGLASSELCELRVKPPECLPKPLKNADATREREREEKEKMKSHLSGQENGLRRDKLLGYWSAQVFMFQERNLLTQLYTRIGNSIDFAVTCDPLALLLSFVRSFSLVWTSCKSFGWNLLRQQRCDTS